MRTETRDLLKAWLAISLAFAIATAGFGFSYKFMTAVAIAAFTVGVGFLSHELTHKFVAQKFGCWAEFRSFDRMLIIAIVMSFFGFVFAAPGGVFIRGRQSLRHNGIISASGPATNIVVSLLFLGIAMIVPSGFVFAKTVASYGFFINSWLAAFNLLPFFNFDGKKVLDWSKPAYFVLLGVSIVLVFGQGLVFY
jgi:Zn-dependent protease